jgi:hypothetical protein
LKFGGGKALTKHAPDETALKCHLTIEETKIAESNRLVICDTPTIPQLENKLEVTPIRTGIKMKSNGLENDMPELYDLEEGVKAEKPVKIELDIDLYQMEQV